MTVHRTRPETAGGAHEHDIVIIGGGNAGISLAARLRRDGFSDVAVVEPLQHHLYRPLLSYVGGGQARMSDLTRRQAQVMPRGVSWYAERVSAVDPVTRTVRTEEGSSLTARDLVVCPGVTVDWDAVPGSREAVYEERGASNYADDRAAHTWELVRGLRSGRAVFAVADGLVPCAGVGLKPLFLAADHWRRRGVLDDIEITAVVGWPSIFGLPRVDAELQRAADRFGVRVVTRAELRKVDAAEHVLHVETPDGPEMLPYDLLHLVPPHRPPAWVAESGLAAAPPDDTGLVDVSPTTLASRRHVGVWGLGDAATVDASRSGGALRKQVPVVADNLTRSRAGQDLVGYDGYTTAPITVSRSRLLLAEFDREGRPSPSVPVVDLVKPRWFTWAYDRYLQPQLYWHSILAGRVRR